MGKDQLGVILRGVGVLLTLGSLFILEIFTRRFNFGKFSILQCLISLFYFYFGFFVFSLFIPDLIIRPRKIRRLSFYGLPILLSLSALLVTFNIWQNLWISIFAWVVGYALGFVLARLLFPRMFKDFIENFVPGGPPAGGTGAGTHVDKNQDSVFFDGDELASSLNMFEEGGHTLSPAQRRQFLFALEDRDLKQVQQILSSLKRS